MKKNRIIIDTNLWISFLISNQLKKLDSLFEAGFITLLFSDELIDEFLEVSARPKFKKYFKKSDIDALISHIDNFGELIKINSNTDFCRDPKDNFLINLAIDGKADFLLSGDEDLLSLMKIGETKILTWAEFLNQFNLT